MTTAQIAAYAAKVLKAVPEDAPVDSQYGDAYVVTEFDADAGVVAMVDLGSTFALDPCGRYHHMLSPNGVTQRCIDFWESLERQLSKRGLWLTSGEGSATDNFACLYLRDADDDDDQDDTDPEELALLRAPATEAELREAANF